MRMLAVLIVLMPWAAPAEYAQVNGLKMYYEVHGQGRPVVLLHGGMNTIETSFSRQIGVLAKNHRVIAIEQMAHGHTADVAGRDLSYEGMAEDTAALLVQLGIRNADLVGWSDGGQIALRLAFKHPELVRRVAASGVGIGPSPEEVKQLAVAPIVDWFPEAHAAYARVSPDGAQHWRVLAEKCRVMWGRPTWGTSEADLKAIKAPVLIIAGDREDIPMEEMVRVFRALPNGRLFVLPATRHSTFQDRPDWLNPVLLNFLDSN